MPIATGIATQLRAKKESTWGTFAGSSGAQILRRVTSSLALSKDTYQSNELRDDYQIADFRHGSRKVGGTIAGELSCGTYQMFIEAGLRKVSAAVTSDTAVGITVAVDVAAPNYTVTRAAGDWLAKFRVGMVIRISVGSMNALNLNKNLLVTDITSATVMKVRALGDGTMFPEGPIAGNTVAAPGKYCIAAATGHTNDSFSVEHWRSDISVSEQFLGCRVGKLGFKLPPGGMATLDIDLMGKDMVRGAAKTFTAGDVAASTGGVLAAVNGAVRVGGVNQGILTGLNFDIDGGMSMGQVVGSNFTPDIFAGRIAISGQMSVYYQDGVFYDNFLNESEIEVIACFTASNANNADFMSMCMSRVKLGGATPADGEKGIIQTVPFTALLNTAGSTTAKNEKTTFLIQDSLFV